MTVPTTQLIQKMIDMSLSTHERFIIEELPGIISQHDVTGVAILYTEYKIYHKMQGDNAKPLPYKYLRNLINTLSNSKYKVVSVVLEDKTKMDQIELREEA
jgi:hypothetical protein